jgi:hypothetical protein
VDEVFGTHTHTITAADPLPDDLRQALEAINHAAPGRAAEARRPGTQKFT